MKIVECVPNISDGRRPEVYNAVARAAVVPGVELLDVDPGRETNRTVITFVGSPEAVVEGAFQLISKAHELIDMRGHSGEHPRFGATDVCPFVPVSGVTMEDCVELAKQLAERVGTWTFEMVMHQPGQPPADPITGTSEVRSIMDDMAIPFERLSASRYAGGLRAAVRHKEPHKLLDLFQPRLVRIAAGLMNTQHPVIQAQPPGDCFIGAQRDNRHIHPRLAQQPRHGPRMRVGHHQPHRDLVQHLGPGPALPDPVLLFAIRRPIAKLRDVTLQQGRNGHKPIRASRRLCQNVSSLCPRAANRSPPEGDS